MTRKEITSVQRTLLEVARRELGASDPAVANWTALRNEARNVTSRWADRLPWHHHIPEEMRAVWKQFSDEGKVMVLIVGYCAYEAET
jgi:hypothetical protein